MGRRKEVALEEKVSLVEECLTGRLRMREAAGQLNMRAYEKISVYQINKNTKKSPSPSSDDGDKNYHSERNFLIAAAILSSTDCLLTFSCLAIS